MNSHIFSQLIINYLFFLSNYADNRTKWPREGLDLVIMLDQSEQSEGIPSNLLTVIAKDDGFLIGSGANQVQIAAVACGLQGVDYKVSFTERQRLQLFGLKKNQKVSSGRSLRRCLNQALELFQPKYGHRPGAKRLLLWITDGRIDSVDLISDLDRRALAESQASLVIMLIYPLLKQHKISEEQFGWVHLKKIKRLVDLNDKYYFVVNTTLELRKKLADAGFGESINYPDCITETNETSCYFDENSSECLKFKITIIVQHPHEKFGMKCEKMEENAVVSCDSKMCPCEFKYGQVESSECSVTCGKGMKMFTGSKTSLKNPNCKPAVFECELQPCTAGPETTIIMPITTSKTSTKETSTPATSISTATIIITRATLSTITYTEAKAATATITRLISSTAVKTLVSKQPVSWNTSSLIPNDNSLALTRSSNTSSQQPRQRQKLATSYTKKDHNSSVWLVIGIVAVVVALCCLSVATVLIIRHERKGKKYPQKIIRRSISVMSTSSFTSTNGLQGTTIKSQGQVQKKNSKHPSSRNKSKTRSSSLNTKISTKRKSKPGLFGTLPIRHSETTEIQPTVHGNKASKNQKLKLKDQKYLNLPKVQNTYIKQSRRKLLQ